MKGAAVIKKPRLRDYINWDLPFERIAQAFDEYDNDKRAYQTAIVDEIKETGIKGISLERLRILMQSEGIAHRKGGRLILEWRYQRFLEGKPVLRTHDYLKTRELPDYTLIAPSSSMGAGLPLDVWTHYIFPHLSSREVWSVGLSSRQFQKRAHAELMRRAKHRYGARGTPMAILLCENPYQIITKQQLSQFHIRFRDRRMCLMSAIAIAIETFGCLDYCKTFPQFREEQKNAEAEDSGQESKFIETGLTVINRVTPLRIKWSDQRAQFEDFTAHRMAHFLHWPAQNFLGRCTALINQGNYAEKVIQKSLCPRLPQDLELRLLKWAGSTNLCDIAARMINYGKGNKWMHVSKRNMKHLFDALYLGYNLYGGMDWLESVAFQHYYFQNSIMDAPDACFVVGKFTFQNSWSSIVIRRGDREYYEASAQVFVEGTKEKRTKTL